MSLGGNKRSDGRMWIILDKLGPPGLWVTVKENDYFLLQSAERRPASVGGGVISFLRLSAGSSGRSAADNAVGSTLALPSPLFYRVVLKSNVHDEDLITQLCHNKNLENSLSQAADADSQAKQLEGAAKEDKKDKKKREKEEKKREKEEKVKAKKAMKLEAKKGRANAAGKAVNARIVAVSEEKERIEEHWQWLVDNILLFLSYFDRSNPSEEEELW